VKVKVQLCDVNVALIAITPFETLPRLPRIFSQFYSILYGSYKLSKNSPVFWPTMYFVNTHNKNRFGLLWEFLKQPTRQVFGIIVFLRFFI